MTRKQLKQIIKEEILKLQESNITDKDWDRMVNLVATKKDGEGVAKSIKDKSKAMARFVAGIKLANSSLALNREQEYTGTFSDFGNKALELGATTDEIEKLFNSANVPTKFADKLIKFRDEKYSNSFVGPISKALSKIGADIKFLPHNGIALTNDGYDAMSRNGRKWAIGYKTEITFNDKKYKFNFDAITDEGGRTTYYSLDKNNSSIEFPSMSSLGINKFLQGILSTINK